MRKLESSLQEWVAGGIISSEQADRIRSFEDAKPERSWVLSGLLLLGTFIVGVGVISIIAANWENIPDAMKLAGDFAILGGLAYLTAKFWSEEKWAVFDATLSAFMIAVVASIGLISQIFHTGGQLHQALFLWCGLTLAPSLFARHVFPPFMWIGTFLIAVGAGALNSQTMVAIFKESPHALGMVIPLFCGVLTIGARAFLGDGVHTRAFRWWMFLTGLGGVVVSEFADDFFRTTTKHWLPYLPGFVFALILAVFLGVVREYNRIQRILLGTVIVSFVLHFQIAFLEFDSSLVRSVVSATLTIITLTAMAVFMAGLQARRTFQWLLFMIGGRFLVLYFQAFGGLAQTGLGLIISGGIVIGVAMMWNKYRKSLATWAEGIAK